VSVSGRLFDTREVNLSCTLSLARPLAYTRGSCIPVHLSIACTDPQGLDLLSIPTAPCVKLLELVETRTTAHIQPGGSAKDAKITHRGGSTFVCESRVIRNAVWWVDPAPVTEGCRKLFGEIHFGFETTPPFDIPDARLYVSVLVSELNLEV
jgi:hypothetical protein